MRSVWRTLDRALVQDIALICLAAAMVGVSFGAIAVSSGLPVWLPIMLSALVFAGASQFVLVGIVASGGNLIGALVAALLVNARHLPFGFAVADLLGTGGKRILGAHLMIDESVAFALAQSDGQRRRAAYWSVGIGLFVAWNAGVALGAVAGSAITDTDSFGLDAAFPAMLLALVCPSLRETRTRIAAALGALIALASTAFLPAGVPVLLAVLAVFVVRPLPPAGEDVQAEGVSR